MSSIIIVLPKIEDAKSRKYLCSMDLIISYHALQVPLLLWK